MLGLRRLHPALELESRHHEEHRIAVAAPTREVATPLELARLTLAAAAGGAGMFADGADAAVMDRARCRCRCSPGLVRCRSVWP